MVATFYAITLNQGLKVIFFALTRKVSAANSSLFKKLFLSFLKFFILGALREINGGNRLILFHADLRKFYRRATRK
jgi:hypothetical protein